MSQDAPSSNDLRDLNPSTLEGTRRRRVFVGGSYDQSRRAQLDELVSAVRMIGYIPVVADWYKLEVPEIDIHDDTLALLHSCKLAIFELSVASGALMEIERVEDYGIETLVLFSTPSNASHLPTRMLSSFIEVRRSTITLRGYADSAEAVSAIHNWLGEQHRKPITYGSASIL